MFSESELRALTFPAEPVGHAATVLHPDPGVVAHWDDELLSLLASDVDPHHLGPLRRILGIAADHGCRSVVVEHRYVDLDYRSEYAVFWAERFEDRGPLTRRVHFFASEVSAHDLSDLPEHARSEAYIGYTVIRPTRLGPVGRTILRPPEGIAAAIERGDAVLTQVIDRPSLFGSELSVAGVPYCQQDGELLRCAHDVAWLCQYVAWRNGMIGRHLTGQIASMPSPEGSPHRPLPSMGLTQEQMQGLFSEMDIPAIFYSLDDLPELTSPLRPPEVDGLSDEELEAVETEYENRCLRERVLRVACKYLNSGLPVVVTSEDPSYHAFTLVGWRHTDGRAIELIACDDRIGPYEIIEEPELVAAEGADDELGDDDGGDDDDTRRGVWSHVMLPMPAKVYLSGDGAELDAVNRIHASAAMAAEGEGDQVDRDLAELAPEIQWLDGNISIRSRLLLGRKFKEALGDDRSNEVRRLYRLAHLPQYIWLVEFHDRALRDAGDEFVVAELIFDSTSHEELPSARLVSTLNASKDVYEKLAGAPLEGYEVPGPGTPWRSLISGRKARGTSEP